MVDLKPNYGAVDFIFIFMFIQVPYLLWSRMSASPALLTKDQAERTALHWLGIMNAICSGLLKYLHINACRKSFEELLVKLQFFIFISSSLRKLRAEEATTAPPPIILAKWEQDTWKFNGAFALRDITEVYYYKPRIRY